MKKYVAACLIISGLLFIPAGCSIAIEKLRQMIRQDIQEAFKDSVTEHGKH